MSRPTAIRPILPGATIGILGSGQLGRMFTLAARQMGYRVHTYSPDTDTPTGQVADLEIVGSYDDLDAVRRFAKGVDVVTFEFENVPAPTAAAAEEAAPVRPGGHVLHTTQHRLREKTFLQKHGFPVTPFRPIRSTGDLDDAIRDLGLPAIVKTAAFGYDGKGQHNLMPGGEASNWRWSPGESEHVFESFVHFDREVSVVAARSVDGAFAHWGVIDNSHANHILDVSFAPAGVSPCVEREAIDISRGILEQLDVVGVLCVEFFLTRSGGLLVNELAPRPHNSGHLTIDACVTSQFEQQLRAVCGLPLGSTEFLRPAAMANLLGDMWTEGEPNWGAACNVDGISLHLYGKSDPRPGRKMGHITAVAPSADEAANRVRSARELLTSTI